MSVREAWESGLIQLVGSAAAAVGAWLFGVPQWCWNKFKGWRDAKEAAKTALTEGLAKLGAMADAVEKIGYQISPNGGGSLRDAVDRTEKQQHEIVGTLDKQNEDLAVLRKDSAIATVLLRFQADIAEKITFHADPQGRNFFVSSGYQQMLGASERDLKDFGWKNYIAQDEVVAYLSDQDICMRERRRFQRRVNMVRSDGTKVLVEVKITPYPDDATQDLQLLMGYIRPVSQ